MLSCYVDGEFVSRDEEGNAAGRADEEGGGWDIDEDLELPADLVNITLSDCLFVLRLCFFVSFIIQRISRTKTLCNLWSYQMHKYFEFAISNTLSLCVSDCLGSQWCC